MRRRKFTGLLASAAAATFLRPARAQQRLPRIGIIDNAPLWDPFRQALREFGYIEGRSIAFEYRETGSTPQGLTAAAGELAQLSVDVIATYGTAATRAARDATSRIPIVMIGIGEPVGAGLVANLGRPGGNITGNTVLSADAGGKRLSLFKEATGASRVAVLWNPENASHAAILNELKATAPSIGMTLILVSAQRFTEFESAFSTMMRDRPTGLLMTADALHLRHADWIIDYLARHRLPGMFQVRENVVAGGFMSYGADLSEVFRRAAGQVQKILNGTRPGDIPVEQVTSFKLVINLKTAKALDIEVPRILLALADEIIE
jgi:putative ABC transport system substrate-binding protein